jgi:hypothetical protein
VTVELGQRLLRGGSMPLADLETALLEAVERGVALLHVVSERWPEQARQLERELARSAPASVQKLRAAPHLAARLPAGMCERLLAVPLVSETPSRVVEIACVDAADVHVQTEFAFHLQADVRTVHAPLSDISDAIDGLHAGGSFLGGVSRMLEAPPIATSHVLAADPGSAKTAERGSVRPAPPGSEPPIPLVRRSLMPKIPERAAAVATPVESTPREPDITRFLETMQRATSSDEVLEVLLRGLGEVAERVLLFAVKSARYEGRLASGPGLGSADVRKVAISQEAASVLRTAQQGGHYLGRLPATETHAALAKLLRAESSEVYAVRVSISGRPAIIAVISGFGAAFTVSRLADELVQAASHALERTMREKKRR